MNERMKPLVSVVMPTYNMATLLQESIPSILKQDYENLELIIVDDGSTDNTTEVVNCFEDKRLIYLQREHDYIASMNAGVYMAKGKYILRMDADDIMLPQRISLQVNYMENNPHVDVCGSGMLNFGSDSRALPGLKGHETIISSLLLYNTIAHPTVIMRRASVDTYIKRHGSLYEQEYVYAEDYRLWTMMAMEKYQFENLPDILVKHRISRQAVTVTHAGQSQQASEAVRKEYLKYAIQQIMKTNGEYADLVEKVMDLLSKNMLAFQDMRQIIYVLYNRILR